jgi:opacity protein-like surface antigen
MNPLTSPRSLLLAAAFALGLASAAVAGDRSPPTESSARLLGTRHVALTFGHVDLDATGFDARNYGFAYNHALAGNLDARLELDYLRSEGLGGVLLRGRHYSFRTLSAVGRAHTEWHGARVYAELGAGGTWFRSPLDFEDDSWLWLAGVGAEFAVAPKLVVTPYLRYRDAVDLGDGSVLHGGVRAHYALSGRLGLTAGIDRDDDRNTTYALGASLRF